MRWIVMSVSSAFCAAVLSGCNTDSKPVAQSGTAPTKTARDSHEGWWCAEHGIPEEICALCSPKVAAELKAKGDWCAKHDRPDSQCFLCHPELEAKFAAQHEAKFGTKPPKPEIQ
jgi:hypothetical protein